MGSVHGRSMISASGTIITAAAANWPVAETIGACPARPKRRA